MEKENAYCDETLCLNCDSHEPTLITRTAPEVTKI